MNISNNTIMMNQTIQRIDNLPITMAIKYFNSKKNKEKKYYHQPSKYWIKNLLSKVQINYRRK